jgi:hypothetical protein
MSDPEITAPKDPAAYRPRPPMGVTFWAVTALCVLCVLAGVAIATWGPKLWSVRPPAKGTTELSGPGEGPPIAATGVVAAAAPTATPSDPKADVGALSARVSALESHEKGTTGAAAAALAAAALIEASQGSRPFPEELAAVRAASPAAPELAVLSRLAETGAPSRAALAASYPDYAARAASAALAPGEGAHLSDRIVYALSRIVTLRRVGEVEGPEPDAVLARAERLVADGDLDRAIRTLDALPLRAREAMAPWRIRAERRAEIDRQVAALRARALADLVKAGQGGA